MVRWLLNLLSKENEPNIDFILSGIDVGKMSRIYDNDVGMLTIDLLCDNVIDYHRYIKYLTGHMEKRSYPVKDRIKTISTNNDMISFYVVGEDMTDVVDGTKYLLEAFIRFIRLYDLLEESAYDSSMKRLLLPTYTNIHNLILLIARVTK